MTLPETARAVFRGRAEGASVLWLVPDGLRLTGGRGVRALAGAALVERDL